MVRIEVKMPGGAEGVGKDMRERCAAGAAAVLRAIEARAKELAPRRTGTLRDSIRAYLAGRTPVLEATAPHVAYLHFGTGIYGPKKRPFTIRPRKKEALFWPGAAHPVKRVVQKGIRPRDFLRRAVEESLVRAAFDAGFEKGGTVK